MPHLVTINVHTREHRELFRCDHCGDESTREADFYTARHPVSGKLHVSCERIHCRKAVRLAWQREMG